MSLKEMHTGIKIKRLRALMGLTQDELAAKINKTRALVSHIEQTGKVNAYTLNVILKVLSVSADEFEKFDADNSKKLYKIKEEDSAVAILKERLESYQKENKALKEIIQSQKKTISILEKKK